MSLHGVRFNFELLTSSIGVCLNLLMGTSELSLVNQIASKPPRIKAIILQLFSDTVDKHTVTPYAGSAAGCVLVAV